MKYKFGALIVNGSGKLGGSVVSRNHFGTYSKTRVSPTNPQSSRQLSVRGNFLAVIQAWELLSDSERISWVEAAKSYPQFDRFGDKHILSGYGLFVKCNQVRLNLGLSLLSSFIIPSPFFEWNVPAVNCFSNTSNIWFFINPVIPPGYQLSIYSTTLLSQGVNYVKGQLRLIGYLTSGHNFPVDIFSMWQTIFGSTLTAGKRLFFKISLIEENSGFVSNSVIVKCDIIEGYGNLSFTSFSSSGKILDASRISGISSFFDNNWFAGCYNTGIIINSLDNGNTWNNAGSFAGITGFNGGIALSGGIGLLGSSSLGSILRSVNYGVSWSNSGTLFGQSQIHCFCITDSGVLLAGTNPNGYILRSIDNGVSWSNIGQLGSETQVFSLCYLGNNIVIAGTGNNGKIFKSLDNGLTWSDTGFYSSQTRIYSLCNLSNGVCLAGSYNTGHIYRSINYGSNWEDLGQMFSQSIILSFSYVGNGVVIAGTNPSGLILVSFDYGMSFVSRGSLSGVSSVYSICFSSSNFILIGTSAAGAVFKSLS